MNLPAKLEALTQNEKLLTGSAAVGLAGAAGVAIYRSTDGYRERRIEAAYPATQSGLAEAIVDVADELGADAFALANLIRFESGFNPQAVNAVTNATGLIQFIPRTARSLGTTTAAIKQMSAVAQMALVRQYLAAVKVSRKTSLRAPYKLAMAVFYPKAIKWPSWALFPWRVIKANGFKIFTPGDYYDRMAGLSKLPRKVGLLF